MIFAISAPGCDFAAEESRSVASQAPQPELAPPTPPGRVSISELRRELGLEKDEGQFARTGGEITQVELYQTEVSNLSPLEGLPLEALGISECPVDDFSPLAGMPLKRLSAQQTQVADLDPLAKTQLRRLYLLGSPIVDIAPLADLPITHLNLVETQVTDLAPIESMPLNTLWIGSTKIDDLAALRGKSLVSLDIEDTAITDLSPLAPMQSLRRLNIAGTKVTDLTPLAGHQLERLIFDPSRISKGLPMIRQMSSLREMGSSFESRMPPNEFWAKYEAGELGSDTPEDAAP